MRKKGRQGMGREAEIYTRDMERDMKREGGEERLEHMEHSGRWAHFLHTPLVCWGVCVCVCV